MERPHRGRWLSREANRGQTLIPLIEGQAQKRYDPIGFFGTRRQWDIPSPRLRPKISIPLEGKVLGRGERARWEPEGPASHEQRTTNHYPLGWLVITAIVKFF